jgi:hypothetical protein
MSGRRLGIGAVTTIFVLNILAGAALAGPEWCDDGSPPPNDWRFRKTGAPSDVSRKEWLRSTTGGELDLEKGVNTLQGGVAVGMWSAVAHAPSQEDVEARRHDRDDDDDDDGGKDGRKQQKQKRHERGRGSGD